MIDNTKKMRVKGKMEESLRGNLVGMCMIRMKTTSRILIYKLLRNRDLKIVNMKVRNGLD